MSAATAARRKTAGDLQPGDRFNYRDHAEVPHVVTVLRPREETRDMFGLPLCKFWCESGGREGWMVFGAGALIDEIRP